MWHNNPNCGNIRETKKEKQRPFCGKALMPHCDLWCAHRAKDCALVNTKGEENLPPWRERGRFMKARGRRQGFAANLATEAVSPTKL